MADNKSPRARKLERDRARGGDAPAKKGSTRHVAAKKAAKKSRVKPLRGRDADGAKVRKRDSADETRTSQPTTSRGTKPSTSRTRDSSATSGRPPRAASGRTTREPSTNSSDTRARKPRARQADRSDFEPETRSARTRRTDDAPTRSTRGDRPTGRGTTSGRSASGARSTRGDDRARDDRGAKGFGREDRPARPTRTTREDRGATARPSRRNDSDTSRRSPAPRVRVERDDDRAPRRSPAPRARVERDDDRAPRRAPGRAASHPSTPSTHASEHQLPKKRTAREAVPAREPLPIGEVAAWRDLGIAEQFLPILARMGISSPFPIQQMTIPDALGRRDVLGRAQTGSGKTLAFGLSMLSTLAFRKARAYHPLSLVMVPTRELAMQVTDALMPFAQAVDLDIRLVAGGMPYAKQIDALRKGVQILVATPGRLNDLVEQGHVHLDDIEVTVIDEADQMCDMGFAPQITEALDLIGPDAQHLLFSATLDGDVDTIVRTYLHEPVRHSIAVDESRMEAMEHFLLAVHPSDKPQIVAEIASRAGLTIMFARTQLGVERIAGELMAAGVACGALHGGKTQAARTKTLNQFKDGTTSVLVATDVAARGIHVDGVSLVVHIDPPKDPKDYVHRAGRTARAGAEGTVVTLVNPRQQRTVLDMMGKAGVDPTVIRVRPMDEALVQVTGAREPSGIPWRPPAEKRKSGGRPPARSGGRSGPRSSGSNDRPRSSKPRS